MKPTKLLFLITTIACLSSTLAFAGDHNKKSHSKKSREEKSEKPSSSAPVKPEFYITTREKEILQTWYKANPINESKKSKDTANLPPGLAKKVARGGKLPPGWQKKVCRGETFPPDVYEHCQPLPPEVSIKLPVPPVGTILVRVEGKIARILEATHEILDVFDVLPKPNFPKALPGV